MSTHLHAAVRSLRFWSLLCFGVSLLPVAWYLYVAWIVPAWAAPHLAGDPAPEHNYVLLLIFCAICTAVGAGVASALSIAGYQALARPRPSARLTECVTITGVHGAAVLFLVYIALRAAIG